MFNHLGKTHLGETHKGMLLALAGFTAFAISDVFAKYMAQNYSVFQTIFMSNLFGGVFLLALLPKLGGVRAMFKVSSKRMHLLRAALNVSISLTVVYSFTLMPIANVYTFLFAMPFFASLIAIPLYGEHISKNRWAVILIGFFGVILALQPGTASFDLTLLWPVLSAILIAFMFTLSKSLKGDSLFSLGFWPILMNIVLCGGLAIYNGFAGLPVLDIGLFAIHGVMIAIGVVCVSNGFRMAPASAASPFLYTEMIWALLFGYLLFGDVPNGMMMVGAGVIVLSGLYLLRSERKEKNVLK